MFNGISKDATYFIFWGIFALIAFGSFWSGVYMIVNAIRDKQ